MPVSVHRRAVGQLGLGSPATQLMRAVGRPLVRRSDRPSREDIMKETAIYEYYAFGFNYHLLRQQNQGTLVRNGTNSLAANIDGFFEKLSELNLQVTNAASDRLRTIRARLDEMDEDAVVDEELSKQVRAAAHEVDITLDAELGLRSAFTTSPKRYSIDHLLRAPDALFGKGVFALLPEISRFDFTEACRCIAFDLATAGAFHLMRGTEGVLRYYYCELVRRKRVRRLMWGDIIQDLRGRNNSAPKTLVDNLDNIRTNFRNPTQHPDARFDMDEAQDLLALSIDVANRMTKDLVVRKGLGKEK